MLQPSLEASTFLLLFKAKMLLWTTIKNNTYSFLDFHVEDLYLLYYLKTKLIEKKEGFNRML